MKSVLTIVSLFVSFGAFAQAYPPIQNGSFEQWQPASMPIGAEVPTGWTIVHSDITTSPQLVPIVKKSTDAASGQYSVVLRPVRAPQFPIWQPYSGEDCYLIYVDSTIRGPRFPERVTGKYKITRVPKHACNINSDSAICISFWFSFFTTVPNVSFAYFSPSDTSLFQWTDFSIDIDSPSDGNPVQYASITFGMISMDSSANPTTQVMLDDLRWDWGDTTTAIGESISSPVDRVTVYPNPATESISFTLPGKKHDDWSISLYTLQGQKVKDEMIARGMPVELTVSTLAPGTYYYTIIGTHNGQLFKGPVVIAR
jgi:hypothetical protein